MITTLRGLAKEFLPKRDRRTLGCEDETLLENVKVLGAAFSKARGYLKESKLADRFLDYNDLELYALEVLRHPEVREHYRKRWKGFLIDEVQDTNPVQAELLGHLTAGAVVTVVGDEKQSIYGFRGADVGVFRKFREQISANGGETVVLEETYRANSALAESMNRVFEPVLGSLHQDLFSSRACGDEAAAPPITLAWVESDENDKPSKQNVEARYIARLIAEMVERGVPVYDKQLRENRRARFGDFAVLSRVWDPLEIYGDAMAEAGVPAVNAGGGSLIDTREFKDGYSLLTFLADQLDDLSLVAVLRSPFFAVSDRELYRFADSIPRDTSWWPVMKEAAQLGPHLAEARDHLADLIKERAHHSPEGLLRLAAAKTGYAAVAANLPHGRRREADWEGTLRFVRGLQEKGWEDLFSVVRYLRLAVRAEMDIGRPTVSSGNAVSLMTVHAAKGLEWPVVFVPDLSRKFPPESRALSIDPAIGVAFAWAGADGKPVEPAIKVLIDEECGSRGKDERRRLLYVALTRAGDHIRLSSTGTKGGALDIILPGLESAYIAPEPITFESGDILPPAPGEPAAFPDLRADVDPVNIATESVMATGISTYAACPQKYKFQYVDGHPGLGEGAASAARIGTLAHLALERDIDSAAALALHGECDDDEVLSKALQQARNFREGEAFAPFRGIRVEKEKRFTSAVGDIRLYGIADLVGDDFVLDYKTDAVPDPDKHSLQLWAYARALRKPKAYIAYLRHNMLHEIDSDGLARLDSVGHELIERLRAGDFAARASAATCQRCNYSSICESSADPGDKSVLI